MSGFIGVDVGGTSVKLGAVEFEADGPRIAAESVWEGHRNSDPAKGLDGLARAVQELADAAAWTSWRGIGLGLPGLVRAKSTLASSPHLSQWEDFDIASEIQRRLQVPVIADNDATNFTRAEWRMGAGAQVKNGGFLTLGTGVGAGFVIDGELVSGACGFVGEPGHITLNVEGPRCPCGNRGCAEMYVAKDAIVGYAKEADVKYGKEPDLTPEQLCRDAGQGSQSAALALKRAGRALGDLLVTLTNILNPECFVIGGGVAQSGDWILLPAQERLRESSMVAKQCLPDVRPAALGIRAGWIGAATLAMEETA